MARRSRSSSSPRSPSSACAGGRSATRATSRARSATRPPTRSGSPGPTGPACATSWATPPTIPTTIRARSSTTPTTPTSPRARPWSSRPRCSRRRTASRPDNVSWELLAQGETGSVLIVGLPDSLSTSSLADNFSGLGYTESGDLWNGGEDLVARLSISEGGPISPQFQYLALDEDRHLVLASDSAPYLREAVRALPDGLDDEGLSDVVGAVGEPLSAAVYSGDVACGELAMSQADVDAQDQADQLVAGAGGVDPLAGFAMAALSDGSLRVALSFENDDQARRNADSRAALASGPAPGQGGTFPDRFDLGRVAADGRVVTMELAAGRRQPGPLRPVDRAGAVRDLLTPSGATPPTRRARARAAAAGPT